MDVTPLIRPGQQVIQSYSGGRFRVSGIVYEGPIIVTPEKTLAWAAPSDLENLNIHHFGLLTPEAREGIILLGTGKTMKILPPELRKILKEKRLNVESMDTGAACRTYNVLMAEGRDVAVALLPV